MVAALALVALGATASLARADDSQIRISEVYLDGTAAHSDFIELQLLADGQAIPGTGMAGGAAIRLCTFNHATCVFFDFPADSSLAASNNQRTVLFGWSDNPNTDFSTGVGLNVFQTSGGDACYFSSAAPNPNILRDCVSWGNSTGLAPSVGSPAPAMDGVQSLTRTEARGCSSLMEAVDDSDNSAADFSLTSPTPRNNFQTPTETPCLPATVPVPTPTATKKKCKKKHHSSAVVAKKKCKKKKR
jgi:hypothetical protein